MKRSTLLLIMFVNTLSMSSSGQVFADRYTTFTHNDRDDGTVIPWVDGGTSRYQQVYAAAMYRTYGLPAEGAFLNSISFRSACTARSGWAATNLQINASTTVRGPDSLSRNFAENVGPDDFKVLFKRPQLTVSTSGQCSSSQDLAGRLDASFFYNPSKGNLLLDFRNHGTRYGTGPMGPTPDQGRLETSARGDDWVSRAYADSVDATQAELVDTVGIYTEMIWVPIPKLRVLNQTNEMVLRWETNPREFRLQTTDSLQGQPSWKDFVGEVDEDSDWRTVRIPAPSLKTAAYFRLFWNTPQPGVGDLQVEAQDLTKPEPAIGK